MATAVMLCCALLLVGSVRSLNDPKLPGIFFRFGEDVGDRVVPVDDEGSSPAISSTGFRFFNDTRYTAHVSLSLF